MTIERVELKHFFLYILTIYLEGLSSAHPVREGASRGVLRWSWDCGAYGREGDVPSRTREALGSRPGPLQALTETAGLGQAKAGKPAGATSQEARPRGQKSPIAVADCVNLSAVWRVVRRCAVAAYRRSGGVDRDKNHPLRLTARCHPSSCGERITRAHWRRENATLWRLDTTCSHSPDAMHHFLDTNRGECLLTTL
jgi:hypothetical protein